MADVETKTVLERLEILENKVERLSDRTEIENLMAKHNLLFSAGQGRRIVPELWSSSEEASIEYGASGVYQGLWKIKTFYVTEEIPGSFSTFAGMNQFLRVAEDGKTAHGVWVVYGTRTDAGDFSAQPPAEDDQRRILFSGAASGGEQYLAEILLQKHEADFVKEQGKWKIFRLHISEYFRYPAGSDWVKFARERMVTDGMWLESMFETPDPLPFHENLPSEATTYHWQYTPDALPELQVSLEDGGDRKEN